MRLRAIDPFGPTIFLGALLLFGSQPLLGKFLLPWFGGTPAVWTTCLLFFQGVLLAGYGYAHAVIRTRNPADQRRLHTGLLAATVIVMAGYALFWQSPILPPGSWKPVGSGYPVARLMTVLSVAIGLPYLVLSATGPLLQSWRGQTQAGTPPWRLYALSNLGSLVALLAYPTIVEPRITVSTQAWLWAAGFVVYALGCWQCSRVALATPAAPAVDALGNTPAPDDTLRPAAPPPRWHYPLWLALAACPSLLLAATTNQMCQEVAPVPFLWIPPLALYLLSLIVCFAGTRYYWRGLWQLVFVLSLAAAYVVLEQGVTATFMAQLIAFPMVLFAASMVCHGELMRLRPDPSQLTGFYLTIAAGGALGSACVALLAPHLFDGFWELQSGMLVAAALTIVTLVTDPGSWLYRRAPWPALAAVGIIAALWILPVDAGWTAARDAGRSWIVDRRAYGVALAVLLPFAVAFRWWRPAWFRRMSMLTSAALLAAAIGILGRLLVTSARATPTSALSVTRNFYGVISVAESDAGSSSRHRYVLRHGRIDHGHQLRAPELRTIPTSYYTESSGFGLAVESRPSRATGDRSLRIGMVGLGVGASAAMARAGDTIRFYEINQAVIDLSFGPANLFTFLKDSPGHVEVVLGDARLSLERELREGHPQEFDILGIDAFSSDAIPTHLLTTQAIEVYLRHLRRPDGILAVHISNRYLDLEPVVRAAAATLSLEMAVIESRPGSDRDPDASSSTWALLAPDPATLDRPDLAGAASTDAAVPSRVWTDEFSNLLAAMKSRSLFR